METRQQRLVRQALEHDPRGARSSQDQAASQGQANDSDNGGAALEPKQKPEQTSLREKSLGRTAEDYVPRTLTPHEWEEYYRERGVPASHRLSKPLSTSTSPSPSPSTSPSTSPSQSRSQNQAQGESSWLRTLLRKLGAR